MEGEVGIAVLGAAGRMGRMLTDAVLERREARLSAATVRPGHPWVGRDLGEARGGPALGVIVTDDPIEAFVASQAALDFTTPEAVALHAELAAQARLALVIGTTGLGPEAAARLDAAARHAVVVRAANMSLGLNLAVVLARRAAAILGPDYDVEIVEMHHRLKLDAPSGAALMLGEAVAEGRGLRLAEAAERGRDGIGRRADGAIGFASLRGGDVVGEHEVIFAGQGERVTLRHVATDRMVFARGAVRAALWGQAHPPGLYSMADVLGLGET